ncbi:MAG TPA: hypothetical protein PK479_08365 [Novosphingobium sp.]|uniref:hypothetical protein n=1 Tax=Novosphingobium sp. TaxID=1874826 RepID=UPI00260A89D0|nr:hypothetical protein [Novosphingobium sp.]HNJ48431.1 hypothetical protein [Novosphingobium sp.]HNN55996.1 hypothetical protein [Novosphingobium sp.]
MASQPPQNQPDGRMVPPLNGIQHFTPPSARELRAQAVQRLQAGLFGIALIVLIVALANIINDRARQSDAASPGAEASASATGEAKTDPLVDAGVVPASTPEKPASPAPSGNPHN